MAEKQLTAQQRAVLFGASTRQHVQMLGTQEIAGGAQTLTFRVPKARIMQGVKLFVEGKVKFFGTGSETTYALKPLDPYRAIRRISIDFNNGFMPVVCSGEEMALVNMLYPNPEMIPVAASGHLATSAASWTVKGNTENAFSFMLDVPLTINYRDPVGLVLAQNAETNIDITIDIDTVANMIAVPAGFTADFSSLKITPAIMSYSIPADTRAMPDMSVLKIVDSRKENFAVGQNYIKLPVGMIYRKLIFKFETAEGAAFDLEKINSNIELVLNTADIPYSINPKMLQAMNTMQAGMAYPDGCLYFSFDFQGINGYGGSRDYIDAERITEFAVRFNAAEVGKVSIISEKLSRLIAG